MKKKGIYVIFDDYKTFSATKAENGIAKKILNQIQTFHNADFDIDISYADMLLFGKSYSKLAAIYKLASRIPFFNPMPSFSSDTSMYNFLYMRRPPFMHSNFIAMLRKMKVKNPNIKIIMEIPTYPYDQEGKNENIATQQMLILGSWGVVGILAGNEAKS